MRKGPLTSIPGGGESTEKRCELCLAKLFLDGGPDDKETVRKMLEHLRALPGRVTLCADHRQDVEAAGVAFRPVVSDADYGGSRRMRRANAAAVKRALRQEQRGREAERAAEAQRDTIPAPKPPDGIEF